jgi:hypothetical protein
VSKVGKGKNKAISVEVWTEPEGSRSSMLPEFQAIAQEDGKIVSRPLLLPHGIFLVIFLLEAELTSNS